MEAPRCQRGYSEHLEDEVFNRVLDQQKVEY
jgi:hypothetical protein